MEKPDWDSTQLGIWRWENTERNRKRKTRSDEEAPTLSEMKQIPDSDVSVNNLLPVGWDEALMERLEPTKAGANQKRARSTDDTELVAFPKLQFTTIECNDQRAIQKAQRAQSEDPSIEACARERRRQYQNDAAHLTVEHDGSEMSRRSPGDRKHRRRSSKAGIIDLSDEPEPSLPQQEEGKDSADLLETDSLPRVVSARRVPPNSSQKWKEDTGTPDLPPPTKTVSSSAGTLRSGRRLHGTEETSASVQGNARDQKASEEIKTATKEEWSYFKTYKTRRPSSTRDYGNPRALAPVPVPSSSPDEESMPIPNGPGPVNRLVNNGSNTNTNTSFKKPNLPPKRFNLVESHAQRDDVHSAKRQRIEGTPTSHSGSSRSPIYLDDESTANRKQNGTPTTKSGQSQAQNGRQIGVEEYHNVEKMMRPSAQGRRNRESNSSDSQASSNNGSKRFLPTVLDKDTKVRPDDFEDPISEDDAAITSVRHIKKNAPQSARKITLEVQIPAFHRAESTTGYQGTSNRQLSRPKNKMWANGDSQPPAETSEFSKYFPNVQNPRQRNNSNESHSADDRAAARASARLFDQQNGSSNNQKSLPRESSPLLDPDGSLDELTSEDFNRRTADALLAKQKTAKVAAVKSKETDSRSHSISLDDFSDDDLANKSADIEPTIFASKKRQQAKKSSMPTYQIFQVFSETSKWLVNATKNPWSLIHDTKAGTLTILDDFDQQELDFSGNSIGHIELNDESSKMIIHKSRDMTASGSTRIYLQFSSPDQSMSLAGHLQSIYRTIGLNNTSSDRLDKVFKNIGSKPSEQKRKRPSPEAVDIQLAKKKSERRNEERSDQIQSAKAKGAAQNHPVGRGDDVSNLTSKPKGLAKSMRTRSNSDPFEDEELPPRKAKNSVLMPDTFYSGHNTRRSSVLSLHETRPTTRSSDREPKPRQQRQRTPTPPLGWTVLNPGWAKEWHSSVIYPAEGKNRARVDQGDIEKLDDREFLNDNLIIFYLRWLQHRLEQEHPEWAKRIYFQNTFFYERLTNPEKGMKGINYAAVERWTAKVNLLDYDFIIVPINEHAHWYVAIIYNAPRLLPSAEVTDHSQSQGDTEVADDQLINHEGVTVNASTSASSPKRSSESSNGAEVDVSMKEMSLEDKKPGDTQDPAPMRRALQQDVHSISKDGPDGQDVVEYDGPAPTSVTSDLPAPSSSKTSQTKKGKRKSTPAPRKYNPKEFRIITLDSLGTPRSATCTNLKEYLVQEIKSKLKIDIPRPGPIGTTAKNIPLQDNFYDCGLFLLSYIEMFLKNPDEFVSGILQNELDVDLQWPKASEMRERIRDLLFNLQKDQLADAEKLGKGKAKAKKVSKSESIAEAALSTKSSSHEPSKSARASPDERAPAETRAIQEDTRLKTELLANEEHSIPHKSASGEPPINGNSGPSNGVDLPPFQVKGDLPKPDRPAPRQIHDLDPDSQESVQAPANRLNGFFSKVTNSLSSFLSHEKVKSPAIESKPTVSGVNVIEIQDPPQKATSTKGRPRSRASDIQHSSRTLEEDNTAVLENGRSSAERVEMRKSSKMGPHGGQSSRQNPGRHSHRDLVSPSPDAMAPPSRIPDEHNFHDLRSPSPESAEADPRVSSEDRERAARAPSPDVVEISRPNVRDHRPISHSANGEGKSTEEVDVEFKGFGDSEIGDSMDEDDPVDLVNPEQRLKDASAGHMEAAESDAEMLLQPSGSQEEAAEEEAEGADASLLSAFSTSSPASVATSRTHRHEGNSAPSSPAFKHEHKEKKPFTSPTRGTKRKNPGESEDWQHLGRLSPTLRDSSDHAIIGRHLRKATHIKFNE